MTTVRGKYCTSETQTSIAQHSHICQTWFESITMELYIHHNGSVFVSEFISTGIIFALSYLWQLPTCEQRYNKVIWSHDFNSCHGHQACCDKIAIMWPAIPSARKKRQAGPYKVAVLCFFFPKLFHSVTLVGDCNGNDKWMINSVFHRWQLLNHLLTLSLYSGHLYSNYNQEVRSGQTMSGQSLPTSPQSLSMYLEQYSI